MSSLISTDQMAEWRALHGEGMVSAVGEYTPEEFWRALDAIDALAADNKRLQAECQMLRGLTPEPPPRPPEGEGLPRFGLRWNGPGQPLSVPMDDGYWTPWHLAASAADHSEDARQMVLEGKIAVTGEALRRVLNALVNAPHQIRELQVTREPVELFTDNPINVLIAEYEAAHAAPAQSAGGVE